MSDERYASEPPNIEMATAILDASLKTLRSLRIEFLKMNNNQSIVLLLDTQIELQEQVKNLLR